MNSTFDISIEEWHKLVLDGAKIPITVTVDGDSMRPLIRRNEDAVTFVPVYRRLKKGDIVLFARNDGAYVCHRIMKIKGETAVTIGDACFGFDTPVHISQVWGIATQKEKNRRKTNLDCVASRLYGRLWISARRLRIIRRDIKRFFAKL